METGGVWFVNHVLKIPKSSQHEANILFQISAFTFLINLLKIPYNALILAHQEMSFYAWTSIAEALLKLLVVFFLVIFSGQKLIIYGILLLFANIIINIIYIIYCSKKHNLYKPSTYHSRTARELTSFSGWNMFGSVADIGYQQGTNFILNFFYGVSFNATVGIATQVKSAIFTFVRGIMTASNPQLFQLFAQDKKEEFQKLFLQVSKISYFLFFIVAIPLIFNMDYLLSIWLKKIPPMGTCFCILVLIFCLIDSLIGPLWTTAMAEGNIKKYQIISSSIQLLTIPFTWIAFRIGLPPYMLYVIQIVVVLISYIYRTAYIVNKKIINWTTYYHAVLFPIIAVSIPAITGCYCISQLHIDTSSIKFVIEAILDILICGLTIWILGTSRQERNQITNIAKAKISLIKRRI